MDSIGKSTRLTPKKCSKISENANPNVELSPALSKSSKSASRIQSLVSRNSSTNKLASISPKNKISQRKFVIAKKKKCNKDNLKSKMICNCDKDGAEKKKCLCVAYESLRASQEEFFKNRCGNEHEEYEIEELDEVNRAENGDGERIMGCYGDSPVRHRLSLTTVDQEVTVPVSISVELRDSSVADELVERGNEDVGRREMSGGTIKRRRERLLEEARQSVPETGSGRVKHLVKAFEKLLSIPKTKGCEEKGENDENEAEDSSKEQKWALPGLQPPKISETQVSSSSFCPSDFFLNSESLGLDSRRVSSLDSNHGCFSMSSRTSGGGRRSRRNSMESSITFAKRNWKRKQLKVTLQKPFKLRTEERGKCKEEEFLKKVQQTVEEEEKQRIPIAQGLPWTTEEPECLPKPPMKESTRPVDMVLHSDIRAAERAEFDHQVAEKMSLIEQYKMERGRMQKMAEEEEIRRLRKELVPKAQPMPYFDRPFVPRRSTKDPTVPREPKFHIPQHKKIKCCMSWNGMYIHNNSEWGMQQ
ncbi:microtubule-destabilizing protein 60-like isoform X1 [Solanum lycopersicum]|uniref:TPX2 C-terminal domain-containing protein n=1 Tax=Solanum lycopersicum TaxID=4081 RepID=K4B730_SOLLC|nr:axoneme-associated protein mst101(2)-like isoform X1 [Solanum lycopersicum]